MGLLAHVRAALIPGEVADKRPTELRAYTDGSLWVRIAGAVLFGPSLASAQTSLTDVSVGTSPVQLSATSAPALSGGILVTAHPNNSGVIRVSGVDVSATKGQPLGPGASWTFTVADASLLYAVSESGTQTLCVSPV